MSTIAIPLTQMRSQLGSLEELLVKHRSITLTFRGKPIALVQRHPEQTYEQFAQAWGGLKDTDLDSDGYWKPITNRKSKRQIPNLD